MQSWELIDKTNQTNEQKNPPHMIPASYRTFKYIFFQKRASEK